MLMGYCESKSIKTNSQLQSLLNLQGYTIDTSTIGNYRNGKRKIPPSFIYYISAALELEREQTDALIQAHIADIEFSFIREFTEIMSKNGENK